MKKINFPPLYAVNLLICSAISPTETWDVITSEEFVEKIPDNSQTETQTQQLENLQIVRQGKKPQGGY